MGGMIEQNFHERFDKTFEKRDPEWGEVARIFSWLRYEASCAREFEHLVTIDDLRRLTELRFSQLKRFQKKVDRESRKVNETQKKRDAELRTITSRKKGKIPFIEGETEKEKIPPSS